MTESILVYWPIILAAIGSTAWFIRLEGKVNYNIKMIEMLQENNQRLEDLKGHVAEIRNDLKWIKKSLTRDNNG